MFLEFIDDKQVTHVLIHFEETVIAVFYVLASQNTSHFMSFVISENNGIYAHTTQRRPQTIISNKTKYIHFWGATMAHRRGIRLPRG